MVDVIQTLILIPPYFITSYILFWSSLPLQLHAPGVIALHIILHYKKNLDIWGRLLGAIFYDAEDLPFSPCTHFINVGQ